MANAGIAWSRPPSGLAAQVQRFGRAVEDDLADFATRLAEDLVAFMKANRPWTDRTGDARRLLNAKVVRGFGGIVYIIIGHGVPYGVFLEVRWGGRFGILQKTIRAAEPQWRAWLTSRGFR